MAAAPAEIIRCIARWYSALRGRLRQNARMPDQSQSRAGSGIRFGYGLVYAGAAMLGTSLFAKPATSFVRGLGLLHPVLPQRWAAGAPALILLLLLAALTLRFALALAAGARPRVPEHVAFLSLLAAGVIVRALAGHPAPPADPAPALEAGLRVEADALERDFSAGRYTVNQPTLAVALDGVARPGFVSRGRLLPLHLRLIEGAAGPQVEPLGGDAPGTVYLALSPDRARAFLTALTLHDGRTEALRIAGRPLVLETRGGTHAPLGRDPLLPAYPSMRPLARPRPIP